MINISMNSVLYNPSEGMAGLQSIADKFVLRVFAYGVSKYGVTRTRQLRG